MGIVRFALRFPHTFYVVAALILFLGVAAIRSMPTDIFPEIRIPVVTVIWQYTGLTTPEMEQRVTTCSQYSISANVNGIKNMEAQTLNGLSIQKIYFQPDVNLDHSVRSRDQVLIGLPINESEQPGDAEREHAGHDQRPLEGGRAYDFCLTHRISPRGFPARHMRRRFATGHLNVHATLKRREEMLL
jgi:Cu/Ag efflux pump CusA